MKKACMRSLTVSTAASLLVACVPEPQRPTATARPPVLQLETTESPHFSEWGAPVNLSVVNSIDADFDAFVSRDGLSLYFAAGRNRAPNVGGRDIWVSHRASIEDDWGAPQNLGSVINTSAHESKPTLSFDGHRLYFASNRGGGLGGFDLYVSRRHDKRDDFGWEPPVNLGSPINSSASEESAITFFEDEGGTMALFFGSNRAGTSLFDIYSSTFLDDETFGPVALVTELSSPYGELDPSIRRDGLEIFLMSNRPGTYGAMDLWVATRASTSDAWSAPVNLGPVINTPPRAPELEQANDFRPSLSFDGTALYFSSAFRQGNASDMFDIWVATRSKAR